MQLVGPSSFTPWEGMLSLLSQCLLVLMEPTEQHKLNHAHDFTYYAILLIIKTLLLLKSAHSQITSVDKVHVFR